MRDRFRMIPTGITDWGIVENEYPLTVIFYHVDKELVQSLCDSLNRWEESREYAHKSKEWDYWRREVRELFYNSECD